MDNVNENLVHDVPYADVIERIYCSLKVESILMELCSFDPSIDIGKAKKGKLLHIYLISQFLKDDFVSLDFLSRSIVVSVEDV